MSAPGGFVADASVGVSWAMPSQRSDVTNDLLDQIISGIPFVVPALWPFEVGNALLALKRRGKIDSAHCARARRALERLNPVIDDEGQNRALAAVWQLADDHALSVYDAAYLELAQRRGLDLASRDAGLNRAAKRCGVRTLL
ncbi:MAG TPA: type II toxin-antitoxin system VapC family toxin [Bryobacteraceae bacterium]|nr:type II toxin-antitoxin system VapC family toxin [Bryobacteraceae bacterium]